MKENEKRISSTNQENESRENQSPQADSQQKSHDLKSILKNGNWQNNNETNPKNGTNHNNQTRKGHQARYKGGWVETNERFVNPYNFVPLEGECKRYPLDEQREIRKTKKAKLTGYIECNIELLSPLCIPNTSSDKAFQLKGDEDGTISYDFFSYNNLNHNEKQKMEPPQLLDLIIPGSEIRGAVRSVHEAAFNGCMSSVDLDQDLSRRSGAAKKAGLLKKEDDEWVIIPCKRLMLNRKSACSEDSLGMFMDDETYNQMHEGDEIWINKKDYERNNNRPVAGCYIVESFTKNASTECPTKGYLHKGEPFGKKKHSESVFIEQKGKIMVPEEEIHLLEKVLKQYRNNAESSKKNKFDNVVYSQFEINDSRTLVYYEEMVERINGKEENVARYLCPACIGREVFHQSIRKILQNNGAYDPCVDRNHLCSTCQIFGMVGKEYEEQGSLEKVSKNRVNNENAREDKLQNDNSSVNFSERGSIGQPKKLFGKSLASKVRFEDAKLIASTGNVEETEDQTGICHKVVVLPELSQPKISAVEFYTEYPYIVHQKNDKVLPDYKYWTYDYRQDDEGREMLGEAFPKLRGRKFYWHSKPNMETMGSNILLSGDEKRRQRVRVLCPNENNEQSAHFSFRVFFDQLWEDELTRLCWALDFEDGNCAHKIGKAKPYGFGSVRIEIGKIYTREIDEKSGKRSIKAHERKAFCIENKEQMIIKDNIEGANRVGEINSMEALKTIMNWEEKPKNVSYPKVEMGGTDKNSKASHHWFTANRTGMAKNASAFKPSFFKILPKIEEEVKSSSIQLYQLKKINK